MDRVLDIKEHPRETALMEIFAKNARLWVCGSTWPPDEQRIIHYYKKHLYHQGWKLVLVPHEIDQAHIQALEQALKNEGLESLLYAQSIPTLLETSKVLIVNQMGLLSSLYRYADVTYVGGGFGRGIHNTLEAAVYGIPVLFGKNYRKFAEAHELIARKIAFCIDTDEDIHAVFQGLNEEEKERIRAAAGAYFEENRGATGKVVLWLKH